MRAAWGVLGLVGLLAGCMHTSQAQLKAGLLSNDGMQPAIRALLKEADVAPSEVKRSKIPGYWEVNAGARRYLVNDAGSTLTAFSVTGSPAVLTLDKMLFITPGERPVVVIPSGKKPATPEGVVVVPAVPAPAPAAVAPVPKAADLSARIGYGGEGERLSPEATASQVRAVYSALPEVFTLNYLVENPKRTIVVFTDYTCAYCQRLHAAIPALNAAGVSVRYLLFPRIGVDLRSPAVQAEFDVMRNMWCAKDQHAAADLAYSGETPPFASCDQPHNKTRSDFPVLAHHELGRVFNVQGTPYIFSDDGRTQEGYSDVDQLLSWLGLR